MKLLLIVTSCMAIFAGSIQAANAYTCPSDYTTDECHQAMKLIEKDKDVHQEAFRGRSCEASKPTYENGSKVGLMDELDEFRRRKACEERDL